MGLLDGKVAVITGSGRGIGAEIAKIFAKEGAKLCINNIDDAPCQETLAQIQEMGGEAIAVVADVTNEEQVASMMQQTADAFGTIDILVNNAGLTRDAMIHKMDDKNLRLIINVNLKGTHVCTKAVMPYFVKEERKDEFKKIINFASTTGVSGNIGQANYAIAKGGIIAYTKSAAREFSLDRVNVNAIAPGFTETRMTQEKKPGETMGMPKAMRDIAISAIPFSREGKGGQPYHIGHVALFLSSYLSDWLTGQTFVVDGGQMI